MSPLRWLAHVYRATFWLAVNLAVVSGLFLLSARFATLPGADERNGLYVFRTVASIWLFVALWQYVARGLLRRPAMVRDAKKSITAAEAAAGTLGCLGRIAVIIAIFVVVGRYADWVYAGLDGRDPGHPARQVADRALAVAARVAERPEVHGPPIVGAVLAVVVLYALASRLLSSRPMSASDMRGPSGTQGPPGRRGKRLRRPDVAAANEAAPAAARRTGAAHTSPSTAAIGAAHAGREDPVLGALVWSASDNAWWARRGHGDAFAVRIEGNGDTPSTAQMDRARAVVQRGFEALLRGSDAARPAAQARGVGLPRFSIASAVVGRDAGAATPVTLHLRCDGDSRTDYSVTSIDGLATFTAS